MNLLISGIVGAVLSSVVLIGGVQAYSGGDPESLSEKQLYSYSDE
ncbi:MULTISPECIES: hypothetical protein [unclassified Nocardioides]|nr:MULTISPECIES: hypothetical protein [unclassified Nocardioides]